MSKGEERWDSDEGKGLEDDTPESQLSVSLSLSHLDPSAMGGHSKKVMATMLPAWSHTSRLQKGEEYISVVQATGLWYFAVATSANTPRISYFVSYFVVKAVSEGVTWAWCLD